MKTFLIFFKKLDPTSFVVFLSCFSLYGQIMEDSEEIIKISEDVKNAYYQNDNLNWETSDILILADKYEEIRNPKLKGDAAFLMAEFYESIFEYEKGLALAKEAAAIYKDLGLYTSFIEAVSDICELKRTLNRTEDIETILLACSKFVAGQEIGYHKLTLLREFTVHYAHTTHEFEKAILYGEEFEAALRKYDADNIKSNQFRHLNKLHRNIVRLELAHSYLEMGQLEVAKDKLDHAFNFFHDQNDHVMLSRIYLHKSSYAALTKKTDSLQFFYEQLAFHNSQHWGNSFSSVVKAPVYAARIEKLEETLDSDKSLITDLNRDQLALGMFIFIFLIIMFFGYRINSKANLAQCELNEALQEQMVYSESLNAEKTKYFAILSHELRTPILAITGLTNLLKEAKKPQKEYVNGIINSGNHLLQLVNNVLQLNRLETADHVTLQCESFDMISCLEEVKETTSYFAQQKGIHIKIEHNLGERKLVYFDKQKLIQILINLTSNAIKHSFENGLVTLQVYLQESVDDKERYSLKVIDNGAGIPKEKIHEIFNYKETSNSKGLTHTYANFESIGIGLYVVARFIAAMSSEIEVQSIPNKRTEFKFGITLDPRPIDNQLVSINNSLKKDFNILAVDDNKVNLMVTKKTLEAQGVVCFTATETDSIINIIRTKGINLVLMDLNMPGVDGYEWTRRIRQAGIQIPIIAHTAIIEEEIDFKRLKWFGLQDYIVKPYKLEKLIAIINEYATL